MNRYRVNVKRQEKGSNSTISCYIDVVAESEINARFAAQGIAQSRWPNCTIMVCEVRKK